ncbi:hypothetical protein BGX21_000564 [Mortierella sp. AD011]|nr:hypothetical protein BGX20_001473 [Mortierella sp. AD010]KAF9403686.1 hypothetical protein BGX21_000564 [Mortierella sp. AD011]
MGSSASKATSGAKSAARHFPSANVIHERAANAAAAATAASKTTASKTAAASSSPKQDYLEEQKRLEEELSRYDEQLKKSGKFDGESRPLEDTPSAAELQFFGNLRSIGQVKVPNPDQIKHQEAAEILKHKLPVKPISSSSNTVTFAQSSPFPPTTSNSSETGANLTSLKLMQLLQLRNQDPSVWTLDQLSEEFSMKKEDIQAVTRYINTYTIVPGKDAKGRESGVWCEDLRGVEILERPSSLKDGSEAEETKSKAPSGGTTRSGSENKARTK